jgi:hypothetical protein
MKTTANNLKGRQINQAMANQQKWHLFKMLVVFVACLPAFSGCSSVEGKGKHQRAAISLVKYIEQEGEKPANSPVHLGQPYMMDPERTLD